MEKLLQIGLPHESIHGKEPIGHAACTALPEHIIKITAPIRVSHRIAPLSLIGKMVVNLRISRSPLPGLALVSLHHVLDRSERHYDSVLRRQDRRRYPLPAAWLMRLGGWLGVPGLQ